MTTPRLQLRPWRLEDGDELYQCACDPLVGPRAGWPPHTSPENSREIIRDILSAPETYALVLRESGRPIGSIGLMRAGQGSAPLGEDEAELGYWLGRPYWGQGLAGEAAAALLDHGFRDLGLKAVWCGWYEGNHQSQRVQEKCGFVYHHTENGRVSPQMAGERTEHFSLLTREAWLQGRQSGSKATAD